MVLEKDQKRKIELFMFQEYWVFCAFSTPRKSKKRKGKTRLENLTLQITGASTVSTHGYGGQILEIPLVQGDVWKACMYICHACAQTNPISMRQTGGMVQAVDGQ